MSENQTITAASNITSGQANNQIPGYSSNPIPALIISLLIILIVFGLAFFFKPDTRLAMELKLGVFGKSLPIDQRYVDQGGEVKSEKFPLEFKQVRDIPYAPAYRIALYLNKSKIMQKDLRKNELEEGGVIGFPLRKLGNDYIAVIEEMHGGDSIKPMSNPVHFKY